MDRGRHRLFVAPRADHIAGSVELDDRRRGNGCFLFLVGDVACTCLWKGYTPEGAVVFKDLCTKEMASASVDGAPAQASEVQAPNNFAGKTYQDYLAANPQGQSAEKKN
jgi:hypothetical protein